MENTNNSSSNLWVGIILGILILGGIFLYMRGNNTADTTDNEGGSINITLPAGQGSEGAVNE